MPPDSLPEAPTEGVLIRAENGDVVTFDATGLTLRLSDTVLADLRARLALPPLDAAAELGDIDAWDLRRQGDWLHFTAALGPDGAARAYQRRAGGGAVIAAAPGPLYGLLSLGGARRAGFNAGPPDFPCHVLAPGDDIGAVGAEGTAGVAGSAALQQIAHRTRDALLADVLLGWRKAARRALPLFMVRTETDASASIDALGKGLAYRNFLAALDSLVLAAADLGKTAQALAVGLDFGPEDVTSTAADYAAGCRALMARIERDMARRGLGRPHFLMTFQQGADDGAAKPAAMAGQWELVWSHGDHSLTFSAPGYMFDQTRFGRPTENARLEMAEMDAHALVARTNRQAWYCPHLLLAEALGAEVRVTARAMADLVIDPALTSDPGCGFSLSGSSARIIGVRRADDDPQALILTCDGEVVGAELRYAFAGPGALRDTWAAQSLTGRALHRWALPAIVPIRRGVG